LAVRYIDSSFEYTFRSFYQYIGSYMSCHLVHTLQSNKLRECY